MTIQLTKDHGQQLTPPAGKVIGFLDGKAEWEAFVAALRAHGYPARKITSLHGDDGVQLLERLQDNSFFFADTEDSVIQLGIKELKQGHFAVAVEVNDHRQAVQITNLAKPLGGHSFNYFGTWVSEQLSS